MQLKSAFGLWIVSHDGKGCIERPCGKGRGGSRCYGSLPPEDRIQVAERRRNGKSEEHEKGNEWADWLELTSNRVVRLACSIRLNSTLHGEMPRQRAMVTSTKWGEHGRWTPVQSTRRARERVSRKGGDAL